MPRTSMDALRALAAWLADFRGLIVFYSAISLVVFLGFNSALHREAAILPAPDYNVPARVNPEWMEGSDKDKCAEFAEHIQPGHVAKAFEDACRTEFQTSDRSHV